MSVREYLREKYSSEVAKILKAEDPEIPQGLKIE